MMKRPVFSMVRIILITITLGFIQTLLTAAPRPNRGARSGVTGESHGTPLLAAQESGKDSAGIGVPKISFREMSHDFGTIPQNGSVTHTFVFRNTGDGQLEIIKAKGS